ncbi:inositol monophosphatase family protein [Thioalbus denitrificans]|uniref:Myo-inositol-1(Or 4)-monophosphatase n=1 Tax=Thioalbus denitrificans TaxID=547122 RepID=A0A369CLN4_9GAMM|nr:inositol monophosphatase family protein [Thioalbus denitrificans]RCX33596.1 myo-inositol-1(or 4)-monophosphatase [Thioalbus denitrificans]
MTLPDIGELETLVRQAAAGEIMPRFRRVSADRKADGSLLTEADLAMDQRLQRELQARWPDIAFLSEEMTAARQQALLSRPEQPLWCLDPLDGTSNFAAGIPCFAVSLALLVDGAPVLGIIFDPVRDECFSAVRGAGARHDGRPCRNSDDGRPLKGSIGVVDFKRLRPELAAVLAARPPYASQRNFGSCALEWAWLATGRGHVHLHGGQKLWDYAAGSLILIEAGGQCATLAGEPLFRPALEPRSVVSACSPALFAQWQAWLAENREGIGGKG